MPSMSTAKRIVGTRAQCVYGMKEFEKMCKHYATIEFGNGSQQDYERAMRIINFSGVYYDHMLWSQRYWDMLLRTDSIASPFGFITMGVCDFDTYAPVDMGAHIQLYNESKKIDLRLIEWVDRNQWEIALFKDNGDIVTLDWTNHATNAAKKAMQLYKNHKIPEQ